MRESRIRCIVSSPIGEMLLLSNGVALTGLYFAANATADPLAELVSSDESPFREISRQLGAYFTGELEAFDVPLSMHGTPFQKLVWRELRKIPFATTISYSQLASRVGRPNAFRAVGAANGQNPLSIIVPCHRVIGANGSLTGYGGGLNRKQWLLRHERESIAALAGK